MKLTPEELLRILEEVIPFNRSLGLRGESVSEGRCVIRLPMRADLVGEVLEAYWSLILKGERETTLACPVLRSFRT